MHHLVRISSSSDLLPLTCWRLGKEKRLAWHTETERDAEWSKTLVLISFLERLYQRVAQAPSDHDALLETLTTTWLADGGDVFGSGTDARRPSALFMDAVLTTLHVIKLIYSREFLNQVRKRCPCPTPTSDLDYGTIASDVARLGSVRAFLRSRYLLWTSGR